MEDHEEKQLKADIMRKTMHSMDTRATTEVTIMAELIALRAWKEKARPFLEADYNSRFSFQSSGIRKVGTKEEREQLAELLGGDDEN